MEIKKIGSVYMRNTYHIFENLIEYKICSLKDENDKQEIVEFIPKNHVNEVKFSLPFNDFDLEDLYTSLRVKHIPSKWPYYYGRNGNKQKFYLRKILCVLITKDLVTWRKEGRKYLYSYSPSCPECKNTDISHISYGLPDDQTIREIENFKKKGINFILGGCVVREENYICKKCQYAW